MSESHVKPTLVIGEEGEPQAGSSERGDVAVTELFRWVYRFFYSKTVGLILILLMAVYAVIGSLVAQTTRATMADPAARQAFLDSMRDLYGGWTGILEALGLFHVFTSIGFYVVVAMLGLSIIACTAHRIPELWRRMKSPRVHVSRGFFQKARYRGSVPTTASIDEAREATIVVLRRSRFRILVDERDPERSFYADKYAWSGIGTVIAHLSFIVILAAFAISSTWGIEEDLAIPVGGTVAIGHGTDLEVTAVSFRDSYTEEGRPADYVSVLQISQGGKVVAEQEVRVNSPLEHEGFRFHQSSFGIATDVTVATADGDVVFQESVPMKWTSNDGNNAVGRFDLLGTDLEVVVATPASGAAASTVPAGSALFEIYRGDSAVGREMVTQGDAATIEDFSFAFDRERQYTGIRLRQDPGTVWMWIGSTLLVVGMSITFMFQYRRLWVRVEDDEAGMDGRTVLFGAVSRLDYSYQRLFESLIAQVDHQLTAREPAGNGNSNQEEYHG